MHIDTIPNRNSRPAYLLRESVREGKRVRKRTLANLSSLPLDQIEAIRCILKGERLGPIEDGLEVVRSRAHGHVDAVLTAMRRLGFDKLLDARSSRERDLVVAMVAERIIAPHAQHGFAMTASKLGMTRAWSDTTLGNDLGVADADEDCLYAAMDWLIERQEAIEKRLAKRHLQNGGLVLFDLTSSYFEGVTCPLAKIGYSRDGRRGTLQVNYGLLTDARGCPVSVSVFEGNTADPKTLLPQVEKVRKSFGLDRLVLAGDRGMISNIQIEALRKLDGVDWITALKSGAIARLAEGGHVQLDLFDERNLITLTHEDYPGERLIACRNPALAKLRAEKRQDLIAATTRELDKVAAMVAGGRLKGATKIGMRVGKVADKYKVAKHFDIVIGNAALTFKVNDERVAAEAALDGLYVIRTSVGQADMTAEQTVLNYKRLAQIERAFRTLKGVDLQVRPIRHRRRELDLYNRARGTDRRGRAHGTARTSRPRQSWRSRFETAISMYNFRADDVVGNISPRPILFFHTADDAITPTEQSIRLFEKAGQPAELMLITGTLHFPLSAENATRTKVMIKAWLDKFFPTPLAAQA